ncbi:alpha-L-fucosidase [Treponema sp. OttesenSCG-928-L16]|nr:alpha-L-fucosidase [Treponema sp. OttesenSCG-928-L16]
MKNYEMPYRQVHLDFHTSKYIEGIGKDFDADIFAETLKKAHVNSINLFTKCHHGMFYYPTKIGTVHPYLKTGLDLFGEQLEACRKNDIRVSAYTCVAWNEDWADRHPEWLVVDYNGVQGNIQPFSNAYTRWRSLCINHPEYKALLKEEFKEVYDRYQPQGFWVDIVLGRTCICSCCQEDMKSLNLDPRVLDDVRKHDRLLETRFCREFYGYIKTFGEDVEVYFNTHPYELDNAQDTELSSVEKRKYFSYIDIESLPSEEWGYAHFPVAVNYMNRTGLDITMMNGKFHTSWGDFGSLRNTPALEYECFRALANGAHVCVGDQLHPYGRLDPAVYERIGGVFSSIKAKEPWLRDTKKLAELGVIIPSRPLSADSKGGNAIDEAVYRVLSELHIPFDYLNFQDDLSGYKLLILPDSVRPTADLSRKLNAYTNAGGKILATGESGLGFGMDQYTLEAIPCNYQGVSEYDVRYVRLKDSCFEGLPAIDHVLYSRGVKVQAKAGAEVLAAYVYPFFNRTYDRFCSHRQTPPTLVESAEPAVIASGQGILISSPLFTDYITNGYRICKDIIAACITRLYPRQLIMTDLPIICETTLRENDNAYILHLVSYAVQRKCRRLDTIEEAFPVVNRTVHIRTEQPPSQVRAVPEESEIPFSFQDGYTRIPIDFAEGHRMYEIVK